MGKYETNEPNEIINVPLNKLALISFSNWSTKGILIKKTKVVIHGKTYQRLLLYDRKRTIVPLYIPYQENWEKYLITQHMYTIKGFDRYTQSDTVFSSSIEFPGYSSNCIFLLLPISSFDINLEKYIIIGEFIDDIFLCFCGAPVIESSKFCESHHLNQVKSIGNHRTAIGSSISNPLLGILSGHHSGGISCTSDKRSVDYAKRSRYLYNQSSYKGELNTAPNSTLNNFNTIPNANASINNFKKILDNSQKILNNSQKIPNNSQIISDNSQKIPNNSKIFNKNRNRDNISDNGIKKITNCTAWENQVLENSRNRGIKKENTTNSIKYSKYYRCTEPSCNNTKYWRRHSDKRLKECVINNKLKHKILEISLPERIERCTKCYIMIANIILPNVDNIKKHNCIK